MAMQQLIGRRVTFDYTNWQGVHARRKVLVKDFVWGNNDYHSDEGFFLVGIDTDREVERHFAIRDISDLELMNEESDILSVLLKKLEGYVMTKEEELAQRRSWVIGQMLLSNPDLKRDYVEAIYDNIPVDQNGNLIQRSEY